MALSFRRSYGSSPEDGEILESPFNRRMHDELDYHSRRSHLDRNYSRRYHSPREFSAERAFLTAMPYEDTEWYGTSEHEIRGKGGETRIFELHSSRRKHKKKRTMSPEKETTTSNVRSRLGEKITVEGKKEAATGEDDVKMCLLRARCRQIVAKMFKNGDDNKERDVILDDEENLKIIRKVQARNQKKRLARKIYAFLLRYTPPAPKETENAFPANIVANTTITSSMVGKSLSELLAELSDQLGLNAAKAIENIAPVGTSGSSSHRQSGLLSTPKTQSKPFHPLSLGATLLKLKNKARLSNSSTLELIPDASVADEHKKVGEKEQDDSEDSERLVIDLAPKKEPIEWVLYEIAETPKKINALEIVTNSGLRDPRLLKRRPISPRVPEPSAKRSKISQLPGEKSKFHVSKGKKYDYMPSKEKFGFNLKSHREPSEKKSYLDPRIEKLNVAREKSSSSLPYQYDCLAPKEKSFACSKSLSERATFAKEKSSPGKKLTDLPKENNPPWTLSGPRLRPRNTPTLKTSAQPKDPETTAKQESLEETVAFLQQSSPLPLEGKKSDPMLPKEKIESPKEKFYVFNDKSYIVKKRTPTPKVKSDEKNDSMSLNELKSQPFNDNPSFKAQAKKKPHEKTRDKIDVPSNSLRPQEQSEKKLPPVPSKEKGTKEECHLSEEKSHPELSEEKSDLMPFVPCKDQASFAVPEKKSNTLILEKATVATATDPGLSLKTPNLAEFCRTPEKTPIIKCSVALNSSSNALHKEKAAQQHHVKDCLVKLVRLGEETIEKYSKIASRAQAEENPVKKAVLQTKRCQEAKKVPDCTVQEAAKVPEGISTDASERNPPAFLTSYKIPKKDNSSSVVTEGMQSKSGEKGPLPTAPMDKTISLKRGASEVLGSVEKFRAFLSFLFNRMPVDRTIGLNTPVTSSHASPDAASMTLAATLPENQPLLPIMPSSSIASTSSASTSASSNQFKHPSIPIDTGAGPSRSSTPSLGWSGPPRPGYDFLSTDQAENADNYDKKWELMRKARSVVELYGLLKKRWRNTTVPDPFRNLTIRQRGVKGTVEPKPLPVQKDQNPQPCNSNFDAKVYEMEKQKEGKLRRLKEIQAFEKSLIIKKQGMKMTALHERSASANEVSSLQMRQKDELRHLENKHRNQFDRFSRMMDEQIMKYRRYQREIGSFYSFYQILANPKAPSDRFMLNEEQIKMYEETARTVDVEYEKYYNKSWVRR